MIEVILMAGQSLSLEELKLQNAESEQGNSEVIEEPEQDIETETDIDGQDAPDGVESKQEGEKVIESWMSAETDAEEADDKTVPLEQHISIRQKLKGERNDLRDENESLRQEIEKLRAGQSQPQTQSAPQAPDYKQFLNEYDELDHAAYAAALAEHQQKLVDHKFNNYQSTQEQQRKQQEYQQALDGAVTQVEEQATKLVKSGAISAEAFNKAYDKFQNSVVSVVGSAEQGQQAVRGLIDHIRKVDPENSAKMLYKLGVDDNARKAVFDAYNNEGEAGGIIALSRLSKNISSTAPKRSQAPAPAKQISGGDKGVSAEAAKLQRKYNEAHKKRDTKAAFQIKRDAKKAGINTKSW